MKVLRSDTRMLVAAVAAIVVLAVLTVLSQSAPDVPLSIRSDGPEGAMALQLWLSESGYRVKELASWTQLEDVDVLFILEPTDHLYGEDDGRRLRDWVQQGHTLIIAGDPALVNDFLQPFALSLSFAELQGDVAVPGAPTLQLPPFSAVKVDRAFAVQIDRSEVIAHLYLADKPVLMSVEMAKGSLWLTGMLRPFTNRGLHDPGSARMIANMLAGISSSVVIGFDEGSHGFGGESVETLTDWLTSTAPGWGILSGFGLTFVFLAMRGRRFGRAEPLPEERQRRESAEYIHAMAALFRRSGQRKEVLAHYSEQLRRRLSERYGIDPHLESQALADEVIARDSTIDGTLLRSVLSSLKPRQVSEADLVNILSKVDEFLRNIT